MYVDIDISCVRISLYIVHHTDVYHSYMLSVLLIHYYFQKKKIIIIIINSRESGNNSYAFCLEIPLIVPIRETNCFPIATGSKKYKQCYYLLTEKNKRF